MKKNVLLRISGMELLTLIPSIVMAVFYAAKSTAWESYLYGLKIQEAQCLYGFNEVEYFVTALAACVPVLLVIAIITAIIGIAVIHKEEK